MTNYDALEKRLLDYNSIHADDRTYDLCRIAADAIRDLRRGVPEGYVLVPKEPTKEMLAAGCKECDDDNWVPAIYRAMISAAQERKL